MGETRDVTEVVVRLLEARKKGRQPFSIAYRERTAEELVSEGRGQ